MSDYIYATLYRTAEAMYALTCRLEYLARRIENR